MVVPGGEVWGVVVFKWHRAARGLEGGSATVQ